MMYLRGFNAWLIGWLLLSTAARAQDPSVLRMREWASTELVKDPVALSFDSQGRLFVAESARRATVDIDIRSHKNWLLDDLRSHDFSSMRSFFRRRMATDLSEQNKAWLPDHNGDGVHDFHDLTTISERIRIIEDTDGNGVADRSTIYADQFQEEFTGVAAGVLPFDGDVYFTVYPDLWKLRDLNDDRRADGRVFMFRGFGVHAAFDGHDLHGLTIGPEGKIYFSCGDNGFSVNNREGKRLHYPNTGGVLRMNPDGTELEVFAYGLRNVQEFDFDQYGNMFGVDNDGDLADERERAVYIMEGSDAGWRLHWQFRSEGWKKFNGGMTYNPWIAEGMWKPHHPDQPAYIVPPIQNYSVGPGGFKFNPGGALNESYRDFFFCVQFPVQQITAFRTKPRGAGFELTEDHVFHQGLMASSINFGPDGAMYIADWVGKWKPNQKGAIYRLDDPKEQGSQRRKQIERWIKEGVADQTTDQLLVLLADDDRRVRQLAQFELVRRKRKKQLIELAADPEARQLGRIHAIWGLIQLRAADLDASVERLPWRDSDPMIRQQVARLAGDLRLTGSAEHLVAMLNDPVALVQSQAALSLGKIGHSAAVPALVELAEHNGDQDPFLRHAIVMGLTGCGEPKELAKLHTQQSAAVRIAAILALRRHRDPHVAVFLKDRDIRVVREAVRAIHDDEGILAMLEDIATMLLGEMLPEDEPILRRVLSANLRLGDVRSARRLVDFVLNADRISNPDLREQMQLEALDSLAVWNQRPLVDRVEGAIRKRTDVDNEAASRVLKKHLPSLLAVSNDRVKARVTRVANQLQIQLDPEQLRNDIVDPKQTVAARIAALQALESQFPDTAVSLAKGLSENDQTPTDLRRAAMRLLAKRDPQSAWKDVRRAWEKRPKTEEKQFLISLLGDLKLPESDKQLESLLQALVDHSLDEALALDVIAAARDRNLPRFQNLLKVWHQGLSNAPLAEFAYALHGGNSERGKTVFKHHASAQCVRCHDAGGKGKQVGPDLNGIARRVRRDQLLESIIQPSARIAEGYDTVTITTTDGRVVNGTVVYEDPDRIVVGTSEGKTVTVAKDDIEERVTNRVSAMPDMTKVLTPMEVRDLVEYLSTLK